MNKTKLLLFSALFGFVTWFGYIGLASAQTVKTGDSVSVAPNQKIDSMLFASGSNVDIAGEINGDLYCAGQSITITGKVMGDVICAGQTISITGIVEGDVRLAAQTVTVGGKVNQSASIFAQNVSLENGSFIARDVLGGASSVSSNGIIQRDLAIGATSVQVYNQVGRNIKGEIENLSLNPNAKVGGNIEYISKNQPVVNGGATVVGKVNVTQPKQDKNFPFALPIAVSVLAALYVFVSLLIVILALSVMMPKILNESAERAIGKPVKTAVVGFLGVLLAPVLIIALTLTIVGIPLATLLLLSWLIIAMLSGPFFGYLIGKIILKKSTTSPFLIALVGGSVLLALYFVPIIGAIALVCVYVFGSGIVITEIMQRAPKPSLKN